MHDILYYIFASISIISILYIAFTVNIKSTIKGFAYFISGISGLLIITNSQLISLLFSLLLLIIFFTAYLLKDKIIKYLIVDAESTSKTNIFSLLVISLLTAILASLFGNARWQMIDIDHSLNSFGMIFTKYLPFIIAISLISSTIITAIIRIVKFSDKKS